MNYLLNTDIPFEMVTVRYGKPSGTDAVRVLEGEPQKNMPGLGPSIDEPVVGRHGDSFTTFGDYSVSLFDHCQYHGDPPGRSLFDMAAVAIVKNPGWAKAETIPCPIMKDEKWVEIRDLHVIPAPAVPETAHGLDPAGLGAHPSRVLCPLDAADFIRQSQRQGRALRRRACACRRAVPRRRVHEHHERRHGPPGGRRARPRVRAPRPARRRRS